MLIESRIRNKILFMSVVIGLIYMILSININEFVIASILNGFVVSVLIFGIISNIVNYKRDYNLFKGKIYEIIEWKRWIDIFVLFYIAVYLILITITLMFGIKMGGLYLLTGVALLYQRVTPRSYGSRLIIGEEHVLVENASINKGNIVGFYEDLSSNKAKTITIYLNDGSKISFLLYKEQIDRIEKNDIKRLYSIPS